MNVKRIYLSPPCVDQAERSAVEKAFGSGYVAPCGPCVDEFEALLAKCAGRKHAVALSSGTAAIDLAMEEYGVDSSWTVFAPTLTFIATVGPAWHRGARLVFVDSRENGLVDMALLEEALSKEPEAKKMFVGVDLYGRCCDYNAVESLCGRFETVFVCDSAEAVGASSASRPAGSGGAIGIYSFNGNKIITTSGGGAFLCDDPAVAARARSRSQQSREPFPWYEHKSVGYNYRMSNLLGAVGIAQIAKLPHFISRRAEIKRMYRAAGLTLLPDVPGENNWLSVAIMENSSRRDDLLDKLASANIEARPVWKPMHLQPVFAGCKVFGGEISEGLFASGICLPSGSGMSDDDVNRVLEVLKK